MGNARFGTVEEFTCIADVTIRGKDGDALCLAYKTSIEYFVAGVYVKNEGYVLGVKGKKAYYELDAAEIGAYQAEGELPTPLPAYSLPLGTYAAGYSLWLIIAFAVVVELARRTLLKRKQARLDAVRATTPVSLGPPALREKGDHFVATQIMPILRPGEQVQHQAYGADRDVTSGNRWDAMSAMGLFAVLTSQRLLFVKTRIGAFGILLENHGVEWFERHGISNVVEHGGDALTFELADGTSRYLQLRSTKHMSNQHEFIRDVPRLLGRMPSMLPSDTHAPSFRAPPRTF